jgi:hypothetical protein
MVISGRGIRIELSDIMPLGDEDSVLVAPCIFAVVALGSSHGAPLRMPHHNIAVPARGEEDVCPRLRDAAVYRRQMGAQTRLAHPILQIANNDVVPSGVVDQIGVPRRGKLYPLVVGLTALRKGPVVGYLHLRASDMPELV